MTLLIERIPAEFKKLKNLDEKAAIKAVSVKCGTSQQYVKKCLQVANLITLKPREASTLKDRVRKDSIRAGVLYQQGHSINQIATEIGRHARSVVFYLQILGLSEVPTRNKTDRVFQSVLMWKKDVMLQEQFAEAMQTLKIKPLPPRKNIFNIRKKITIEQVYPLRHYPAEDIARMLEVGVSHISKVWRQAGYPPKSLYTKAAKIAEVQELAALYPIRKIAGKVGLLPDTALVYSRLGSQDTDGLNENQIQRKAALEAQTELMDLVKEYSEALKNSACRKLTA